MAHEAATDGTVGKAVEVLDEVAGFGRPVRFSEVLERSRFPKATLHRLMQTLVSQGMLAHDGERQTYALGVRLVRLAHAAWRQSSLAPIARPHLEALARDVAETVHLAQLDHGHVLYVDKRCPSDPAERVAAAGKVGPAYCTGIGKVLLAWLADSELDRVLPQQSFHRFTRNTMTKPAALKAELRAIRARGYGLDREEHETGVICVALPVLTERGRAAGALSITTSTARHSLKQLESFVPRMRLAADVIAAAAEGWCFPD